MLKQFRYILLFCVALFGSFNAIAQLAMPDSVCIGSAKLYYVDFNPIPGSTYNWKIDGVTQLSSNINQIYITWNTAGTYLLEVQEQSADGCLGPLRSGQVFVGLTTPVASCNSPVCIGSSINLSAETFPGGTYYWTGPNGFSSSSQYSEVPSALLINAGIYSLVVSANGCNSEPSDVTVVVSDCGHGFFIPEGFSPNGDGINDLFVIIGIENYPDNSIVIFNRWGDKVFEASPYQNTWDGKCSTGLRIGGDALPVGTYFYILNLGDGSDFIKGTIYLNR